jgi:small subunit ribosomal protein S4
LQVEREEGHPFLVVCKPLGLRSKEKILARYTGPVCRLCRREGTKLFLKGTKCFSDKCPLEKRNFAPGQHGRDRKAKIVGYGLQLREKQKAKRIYFTLESQFREYYEKASRAQGVTGELLLQQLERRLDNVAFRLGFATSRRQARQIVRHGHVEVNGRKVNIPSYQVGVGDEIKIREGSKKLGVLETSTEFASHQVAPPWLQVDHANLSGKVLALPKREDVNLPVNEQLIVELYSK